MNFSKGLLDLFTEEEKKDILKGGRAGMSRDRALKALASMAEDAGMECPPVEIRRAVDFLRGKPGVQLTKERRAPEVDEELVKQEVDKNLQEFLDVAEDDDLAGGSEYNALKWVVDHDYGYSEDADAYEVYLNSAKGKLEIPGQAIRDLREWYCSGNLTRNQCAQRLGMPKKWLVEVLQIFGITHDDLPLTDEEVKRGTVEQLTRKALQSKKRVVSKKIEQKDFQATVRKAEKLDRIELEIQNFADELIEKLPTLHLGLLDSIPRTNPLSDSRPGILIANIQDSHLGKAAQIGELDMVQYSDAIIAEYVAGLSDVQKTHIIEEAVVIVGADNADTDTAKGTTTSGRPMTSSVPPERAQYEAVRQEIRLVTATLQVTDRVVMKFVPGNHDRLTGWIRACAVANYFRNDPRVEFNWSYHHRQYHAYNDHLFMLTHEVKGDVSRFLGETFMAEAGNLVADTRHRHVYVAHMHHEVRKEDKQGVTRTQAPAPIPNDEYHVWQWPNARRQIQICLHEPGCVTERSYNQDVGRHYLASPTNHYPQLPAFG